VLPIALDPTVLRIGLCGAGDGLARRRTTLTEGGAKPILIDPDASLSALNLLFVAGLDHPTAAVLAARAREEGVLVNVEDVPDLCDFHVPAILRRGDLALTVSTSGRAPGLARLLREWLGRTFGPEWKDRLDEISTVRARCRDEGMAPEDVSRRTRDFVAQRGWLP
jgi:precorrin-2 dehydrogenase / sirohydrochlorin ferrochelatase